MIIYFLKEGEMMIEQYLSEHYEKGEPIFLSDLGLEGMTEENLRYHLKRMTDEGKICRFAPGIYYFHKTNLLGEKQILSPETVALHKYIRRKGKRVGFYSGYTLANRLGLSTQVPFKEEITSNYAPAQVREVKIKDRTYIIRRPAAEITEENAYVLQLLDCLKDLDKSAEEDMKSCGTILTAFIEQHNITREQVDPLLIYYPLKIYKAIYETGVKYVSA